MSLLLLTCSKPVLGAIGIAGFAFLANSQVAPPPPPPGFGAPGGGLAPVPAPLHKPVIPPGERFPFAEPIPDKEGFFFNPWTNNPVDCRGIPPGTLVRDPGDPDPDHKFRVPKP